LARNSSFIFSALAFRVGKKNKCAVCALAFLVQMFNFSTIFALLTTCLYMTSSVQVSEYFSATQQAKSFVFCFYLFFSKSQIKRFGDLPNIPKFSF